MKALRNPIRPYAWGSRTAIAELMGRPAPSVQPEAELWLGAHPAAPSQVVDHDGEHSLDKLIEADPLGQLGPGCVRRWAGRLPFLLKVLAVEKPLSLQVHPSAAQAAAGFAAEEAAGTPRDARHRNYPDPTAKPELVCALTEFHALAGMREPSRTIEFLRAIGIAGLAPCLERLSAQPDADGLRAVLTEWLNLSAPAAAALAGEVADACARRAKGGGAFALECRTIVTLSEAHPGDRGVLAALLLDRITLNAGEAIYLAAGALHLYLHGTAVEILANSDNVLRCGLTPKHVDVPELLEIVDFGRAAGPVLRGEPVPAGAVYRTDAPEFELSRFEWPPGHREPAVVAHSGPQILLCTAGKLELTAVTTGETRTVERGGSVWLPATHPAVTVRPGAPGRCQAFRATSGP